jgi:hypothetical protein
MSGQTKPVRTMYPAVSIEFAPFGLFVDAA